MAAAQHRKRPDFIVVGAMKAGTTTLHGYLHAHPEIGVPNLKESDFFLAEQNRARGMDWYLSKFPGGYRVTGEVSPNYAKGYTFPGVPERIAEDLPGCRIILIARDPVKRAISEHHHMRLAGLLADSGEKSLDDPRCWRELIDASLYQDQIERFLEVVPEDRILVLEFEELVSNAAPTLTKLAEFLGVRDDWPDPAQHHRNAAEGLSRLPAWYWAARKSRLAEGLRSRLPGGLKTRLRHGLMRRSERKVLPLSPAQISRIRDDVSADTAAFRNWSGMRFANWSV